MIYFPGRNTTITHMPAAVCDKKNKKEKVVLLERNDEQ
jgi:hypothetical protein